MLKHSLMFTCVLGTMALAACADQPATSSSSDELAARIGLEPAPEPVPVTDGGMPTPDAAEPAPEDGGVSEPDGGDEPPPDGGDEPPPDEPTPECFGDLLVAADALDQLLRQDLLPDCDAPDVVVATPTAVATPVPSDPPGDDEEHSAGEIGPDQAESEEYTFGDPSNCGYSDALVEKHHDAVFAIVHFQDTLRTWLENETTVYTSEGAYSAAALLACLTLIEQPVGDPPPPPQPPPPPVCSPPNTEYNCKAVVWGKTDSYFSKNSKWAREYDKTRGTTCTDDLWSNFIWEKINAAPWTNGWGGQIVARAIAADSGGLWAWEHRKSCLRETPTIQTKFRLMLEPRAALIPRWIWDPKKQAWVENNHNFGFFYNAQNQQCPADCLMANEGTRKFRIGASVRPKLSALFAGIVKSMLVPDGFRDFGNMETNYLSQVTGTLHCFGPGTLYTAQDTFTTLPSDVPMPFNATIAPDCNVTDNVGVNGSITYTQQGQQPQLALGLGVNASQQTSCKRDAGSEIRMSLACNMAEGAGFANFRTADIEMPAYGNACVTNGRCSWLGMTIGGAIAANKLDLGYWFEQLVAIARASPSDGNGWAHARRSSALFARGKWEYDPQNPDWPGRWANHRHAWEGNACRVYKVTNETTGAIEPMAEDKAICVFWGQNLTDTPAAPGVPGGIQPNVMLWPYSNPDAQWDPEVPRPSGVQCTQGSQCSSGVCNAGVCS